MPDIIEPSEQTEGSLQGEEELPRVADAVRTALSKTAHAWLQRLTVLIEGQVVVLQGKVPSYYLKQMAQVTAMSVAGVEFLRNEVQVEGDSL
jgi:osmotically-inducible protein OsmY